MCLDDKIRNCTKCDMYKFMPIDCKPVPGTGPKNAKLMLIGEALGESESLYEKPFIGLAGKTLDHMLKKAGIDRNKCYVSNIIHCRPTKNNGRSNRPPTTDEIDKCKAWIWAELQLVQPKFVVLLGKVPIHTILYRYIKKSVILRSIIGKFYTTIDFMPDTIFVPLYHPSYLMQHGKKELPYNIEILTQIRKLL